MSSDDLLGELRIAPRTNSNSSDFTRFLREQLQHLETQLLMAYGEVANKPRSLMTTRSSGTNHLPVQPRTGTAGSQNSEVPLECVSATSTPREALKKSRTSTDANRCFQVHEKCNMTEEELEDLQALFMVTKPSSRFNTGDGAIESPRSKRDQRQETWPRFLVHPESTKRLFWDCLACMMLFTYTVVVPLEVFHFEVDSAVMSTMLSVRSVWLFFWILDIGMTVRTAVYVDNVLCTQWSCILRKYVYSWFLFDLAVIGLDLWSIICMVRRRPILRIAAVGKFFFMARGVFSFRFHKLLQHQRLMGRSGLSGAKKACGVLLLILVILVTAVHMLACLWFFCGNVEDGWVETEQLRSESWDVQYARSVQWALSRLPAASMASNMALNTGLERAVALGATFSALACGSVFVSVITNLLAGLERSRQHKKNMLKAAGSYIHDHNLSQKHLKQAKDIVERVFGSTRSVTVGVFGLCTAATPQLSQPGKEVVFEQPLEHAKRCVKLLKDQGCAFIVALTHLSLVNDKELAEKCEGINVILGGHDHDPFFLVHRGVLIAKCGQNADHLGILDLHMDFTGPGNSLQVDHSFQFLTTSKAHPDPKVSEIAQKWSAKGQEGADETICHVIDVELSSRTNELRTRENSFGSLVADAMHWQVSSEGCEGAIINGGFVRQDRSYPPGSALTRAMINEEMPFNKSIALQKLTGHQLRKGLEEMLAPTPTPVACFPQLSHSLRLRYAPHAPAMQKIQSLQINGAEVDPQRDYLIAVSEFYTLVAADGVKTFHEADVVQMHEGLIRDSVANYLHTKKEISGELQGRCQAI